MTKKKVSSNIQKLIDKSLEDIISSFHSHSDKKMRAGFLGDLLVEFVDIVLKNPDFTLKIRAYIGKIDELLSYLREHKSLNANDLKNYTRTYDQLIDQYLPDYRKL